MSIVILLGLCISSPAGDLDTIGVSLLRQIDPALKGNGVPVVQVEAILTSNDFEVNPGAVGQPQTLFTWISGNGTASTFPNGVGTESGHADAVGGNFYGSASGVAPNVSHVDNYEGDYFYNTVVSAGAPTNLVSRVVNQSLTFNSQISSVDQNYDDYAAQFNTIFVSAAGVGGPITSPGSSFNGVSVGVDDATPTIGPTSDGRCKPDITAPGGATSFSTPYVSGAAAVLLQAASRGDGGANISAANDARTIKSLLLNGAVKPTDWTNSPAHPLDLRYGAGILNVFNSWKQMTAGKQSFIQATSNSSGSAHAPGSNTNNVTAIGWDFNSITNIRSGPSYQDRVHHYYFNVPASSGDSFTLTATLAWNRQSGQSTISDLNLYLYNATTGTLVTSSISSVDNVEHLFQTKLPSGRYDLQVLKSGTGVNSGNNTESYALAFEAFNVRLTLVRTDNALFLSWPVAPAGFVLQSTTNLSAPSWTIFSNSVTSNSQNVVTVSAKDALRFFRLQRP